MATQTPTVDIEEEIEVPEEPQPEAHVSSAAAAVSGKEAVEQSEQVEKALEKLTTEEPKKPEEKKQENKEEKKKSKKTKVLDEGEGDIVQGIEQMSKMLGIDKAILEDHENWPFCDHCHLLYDIFKSEDGELGIEGLDRFLRVLGQESPIQELRAIMAEWGDKKSGKMTFEQFIDMVERQGESWKIVDELDPEHTLLLFKSFKYYDANRDGNVTADELQTALELCGEKCSLEEVQLLFRHGDRNDDGLITVDEWMMFMSDVPIKK